MPFFRYIVLCARLAFFFVVLVVRFVVLFVGFVVVVVCRSVVVFLVVDKQNVQLQTSAHG